MNQALKLLRWLSVLIVGLIWAAPAPSAVAVEYEISQYEVTVELVPDKDGALRDAAVTMLVTYDIQSGPKSEGFKFVGTLPLQDVFVTDGDERPLHYQVESLKENKIIWYFDESINQGEQTIIAHFRLVGALNGDLERNSLSFDWIKNWKVPVRNVTYRFLLPSDYQYEDLSIEPSDYSGDQPEVVLWKGQRCIETDWNQLPNRSLKISIAPGVAEAAFAPVNIPSWVYWGTGIAAFMGLSKWYKKATGRKVWNLSDSSGDGGCGGCGGGCGGCGG